MALWSHILPTSKGGGVRYVLKYISKSPEYPTGRLKPFRLQSSRLGANYLTPAVKYWHTEHVENAHHTLDCGAKIPLIKYYKEKIYSEWIDKETGEIIADYTDMRAAVTDYMAELIVTSYNKRFKAYKIAHPTYSDDLIHRNLFLSKQNVKFEKNMHTDVL